MSKLEVLELLKDILEDSGVKIKEQKPDHSPNYVSYYAVVLDYDSVMFSITHKIEIEHRKRNMEKNKPEYFDYTFQEHKEALYG